MTQSITINPTVENLGAKSRKTQIRLVYAGSDINPKAQMMSLSLESAVLHDGFIYRALVMKTWPQAAPTGYILPDLNPRGNKPSFLPMAFVKDQGLVPVGLYGHP